MRLFIDKGLTPEADPNDLGPLATGLQVLDLLRINYDAYKHNDNCK